MTGASSEPTVSEGAESATAESPDGNWLESVSSVAHGATINVVGKVAVTGLGFLLTLVLTRGLGGALYGVFAYGRKIGSTMLLFTTLGSDVTNMKYISANHDDPEYQNRVLALSYGTALVVGIVSGGLLFLAAPTIAAYTLDDPAFVAALRLFAIAIPFQGLTKISITTFRGLERPEYQTGVKVFTSLSRLVLVGGAVLAGYSLFGSVVAFVVGSFLAFVLSVVTVLSRTHVRPSADLRVNEAREFYNFSLPFTFSRAGAVLYRRTDLFMVGALITSSAVGIYNVAILIGGVISMPLSGINQLFPSVASRLYADGSHDVLESVYATVTRWSITASIALAAPALVYRRTVMGLFGPEFVTGGAVLALFVVGQLVNAAAGPSNDVLAMTDHQYLVMVNHWVFGIVNVALNYVLILEMGTLGAAVATAAVLGLVNVARVLEVWYLEDLFAYSTRLWKPMVAGVVAIAVMVACKQVAGGIGLLFVGGSLGVGTYALVLVALGIEDQDREFANEYLPFSV